MNSARRKGHAVVTVVCSSSSDENEDADLEQPRSSIPSSRPHGVLSISDSDDGDEDEQHSPNAPKRKRLKPSLEIKRQQAEQEHEKQKEHNKTALQKLLAKKRAKTGNKVVSDEDLSEDSMDGFLANSDVDEDEIVDDEVEALPKAMSNRKNRIKVSQNFDVKVQNSSSDDGIDNSDLNGDEDSDDDGIVEDNDNENWRDLLPTEFSNAVTQPLAESFNIVCQLLASECLEPGFVRMSIKKQDEYYMLPMNKLDEIIEVKKNTLVQSSVWGDAFKLDLEAFPDLLMFQCRDEGVLCEACRRKNRPVSMQLTLSGEPYDRRTLMPLTDAQKKKRNIDLSAARYSLGRFCAQRSEFFHTLHHYKYNLHHRIAMELDQLRSSLIVKDSQDNSELLVSLMDNSRTLTRLFEEFKVMLARVDGYCCDVKMSRW